MGQTLIPLGSQLAIVKQSVGLFAATMQRKTMLNRLSGPFPVDTDAQDKVKLQTSADYPIVRNMDLSKAAGDRITFDFVNVTNGLPIMGDAYAEGLGDPMSFSQDGLHINMTRKPIAAGSAMSQQRTLHDLRGMAMAQASGYMNRLEDQRTLVHLAGARGFQTNGEWAVPLAADPSFASIMINTVRAPSHNRHYMCNGGVIVPVTATANAINIQTTDALNIDLIDSLATWMDGTPFPISPVKFNGDELAEDAPLRVLLVSAEQYNSFLRSPNFRQYQAFAASRGAAAKNNPLFMGDAGLWRGILIVKMPKPIRFYAGNALNHCALATSQTETTTDLIPAGFGTGFAVDRALLLGGQALGQAFGKAQMKLDTGESIDGMPMFYSEKLMDHNARLEILVGLINGMSKIQFLQDWGTSQQYTDMGVVAIDTAVQLQG